MRILFPFIAALVLFMLLQSNDVGAACGRQRATLRERLHDRPHLIQKVVHREKVIFRGRSACGTATQVIQTSPVPENVQAPAKKK